MKYFDEFVSNTSAGSGNQKFFRCEKNETGRIFYKINAGGEYEYSFLFSNIIDSTFSDGSESQKNRICHSWEITNIRAGVCGKDYLKEISNDIPLNAMEEACELKPVTFKGERAKNVMPGEFFVTDPVVLNLEKGDYLCIELSFRGSMIPYHEESLIPAYRKMDDRWQLCKLMPYAGMIGCKRDVKKRIGFFGDSITQGVGTDFNSYAHWNAKLAGKLGEDYAYWNLGLGFGRANDAASDGAWLYKARQNDIVVVCFGVNDIANGFSTEQIKSDLAVIVDKLHEAGAKVILQTIPPFDYLEENREKWFALNTYILETLSYKADLVFDAVPYLAGDEPYQAKFGGHPNAEGCEIWAEALYSEIKAFLEENG